MDGWKRYLISLVMHEKGHRDMAVDAVIDLSFDVADLPPFPRCSDLDRAIRSIARDRNEKLNEDSRSTMPPPAMEPPKARRSRKRSI